MQTRSLFGSVAVLMPAILCVAEATTTTTSSACITSTPVATCASPTATYLPEPCFPTTGVCYPTNYYAAQDQGQLPQSGPDYATTLEQLCQQTCDAQTQCLSYAGQLNLAADSGLATGTCFFYSQTIISPRQCADAPSEIVAYYKANVCPVTSSTATSTSTTTPTSTSTSTSTSSTKSSSTSSTKTSTSSTKTSTSSTKTSTSSTKTSTSSTKSSTSSTKTSTSSTKSSTSSTSTSTSTKPATTSTTSTTSSSSSKTSTSSTLTSTSTSSSTASPTSTSTSTTTSSSTTMTTITTSSSSSSSTSSSSTSTSTTANPCPTGIDFILESLGSSFVADGSTAAAQGASGDNQYLAFGTGDAYTIFQFDSSCQLFETSNNQIANIDSGYAADALYFNTDDQINSRGYQRCTCAIDASDILSCDCGGDDMFTTDQYGDLYISNAAVDGNSPVTVQVVFQ